MYNSFLQNTYFLKNTFFSSDGGVLKQFVLRKILFSNVFALCFLLKISYKTRDRVHIYKIVCLQLHYFFSRFLTTNEKLLHWLCHGQPWRCSKNQMFCPWRFCLILVMEFIFGKASQLTFSCSKASIEQENTGTRYEICSKLKIKSSERRQYCYFGTDSNVLLVFPL